MLFEPGPRGIQARLGRDEVQLFVPECGQYLLADPLVIGAGGTGEAEPADDFASRLTGTPPSVAMIGYLPSWESSMKSTGLLSAQGSRSWVGQPITAAVYALALASSTVLGRVFAERRAHNTKPLTSTTAMPVALSMARARTSQAARISSAA